MVSSQRSGRRCLAVYCVLATQLGSCGVREVVKTFHRPPFPVSVTVIVDGRPQMGFSRTLDLMTGSQFPVQNFGRRRVYMNKTCLHVSVCECAKHVTCLRACCHHCESTRLSC